MKLTKRHKYILNTIQNYQDDYYPTIPDHCIPYAFEMFKYEYTKEYNELLKMELIKELEVGPITNPENKQLTEYPTITYLTEDEEKILQMLEYLQD